VQPIGPLEVHAELAATGNVAESGGQERLAHTDRESDRLQHLRRLLPCEVRVTSAVHPLFGRLLGATGFKRIDGSLFLVVGLPDGSPGTIPVTATDILGDEPAVELAAALSVDGIRELRALIGSMKSQRRSPSGPKKRK
jgi:hypothetical protein